jgi:hypothetical protein
MFLGYFTRHTIEASTGIFRTPFAIASIGFLSFWALLEKREISILSLALNILTSDSEIT